MNFLEIVGAFTLSIIGLGILCVIYSIMRGLVLAGDLVIWQFYMARQKNPDIKFSIVTFFRGVWKNWYDMIGYTSDSFTCQIGSSTWSGFQTWRKK